MPSSTTPATPATPEAWVLFTFDEEGTPDTEAKATTREEGLLGLLRVAAGGEGVCFDARVREYPNGTVSIEHDRAYRGPWWFACLAHDEAEARDLLKQYIA